MLAIVIPFYKITFFEQTLDSLASQTCNNFSVYIGDDASPQNPEDLISLYKDKIDITYKRFNENWGQRSLVSHWYRCINLLENERWINILGDDDLLEENFVEEFYRKQNEFKDYFSVIRYSTVKINSEGKITSGPFYHPKIESSKEFVFNKIRSSLSEYIFERRKVEEIGFQDFPLGWYSDQLAVIEFSGYGNLYSINSSTVKVRISSLSISGRKDLEAIKSKSKFLFYSYLLKNKNFFTDSEFAILLYRISKIYRNDRKKVERFLKISLVYLVNRKFSDFFLFSQIYN